MLLTHGADVNAVSSTTRTTPLQLATLSGQKEVMQLLIDAGADVNYVNHDTGIKPTASLPLQLAMKRQSIDIVRILLDGKANINAVGRDGTTPLWTAMTSGSRDILKLLFETTKQIKTVGLEVAEVRERRHDTILAILLDAEARSVEGGKIPMVRKTRSMNFIYALSESRLKQMVLEHDHHWGSSRTYFR
jgi:hypothetical protein